MLLSSILLLHEIKHLLVPCIEMQWLVLSCSLLKEKWDRKKGDSYWDFFPHTWSSK